MACCCLHLCTACCVMLVAPLIHVCAGRLCGGPGYGAAPPAPLTTTHCSPLARRPAVVTPTCSFVPLVISSPACPRLRPQYAYVIHTTNPTNGDAGEIYCELVGAGGAVVGMAVVGTCGQAAGPYRNWLAPRLAAHLVCAACSPAAWQASTSQVPHVSARLASPPPSRPPSPAAPRCAAWARRL